MVYILNEVQVNWPSPINIGVKHVRSSTGLSLGDEQKDLVAFSGLVNWLMHEKLIRYQGATFGSDFLMVALAAPGWAVLGTKSPSEPEKTIGQRVKDTATDIATSAAEEGAKHMAKEAASVAGDLLGTFVGAYSRSAAGTMTV
ncbi:hypothetical protein [Enterovirga rhinocerotis]|uniref:Uncharacterized protein n=1 Tax=Enterovirga rhinocerotis TaxID=1339210 RepID=A0A4R7C7B3_9HYPH|nr:hypothetical protein [Enterovirga rhinocerotis]TDR94278.1 hypothetical protein EV668_1561 [Enterovirga rhinocerotis]